jgi:hypothetical protein
MPIKLMTSALAAGFTLTTLVSPARAADPAVATPATATDAKPAWLSELSAGVKETYDSSVFLSSLDPKYLVGAAPAPAGAVAARPNSSSWVTAVTPKAAFNFVPLLGGPTWLQTLSLGYAPEFVRYHEQPSENYDTQRVTAAVKGRADAFSFSLDDTFAFIDGSKYGPLYPNDYATAYSSYAPRERRKQIQDRAAVVLRYDWDQWFVRPTASLLYYDLMTVKYDNFLPQYDGYQDYESRYDLNGGTDFGYKLNPQLAVTLGYRYGHQYQQQFTFSPYSVPNDYQRALLGLEGHPWQWLEFKLQGGPDFRDYAPDTATHTTPVDDLHLVTYYGEASLAATLTPRDLLTFKYKQFQWVSSIGNVAYFDSLYDLNYHRQLTDQLGLDLGGRLLCADYNAGTLPPCQRDDWQYTVSAGLGYAVNPHLSVNAAYALNLGRNDERGIANPETRDYNEQLISLGAQVKF